MKYFSTLLMLLLLVSSAFGQQDSLRNYDHVYQPHIKAVKFHINGIPLSNPIIDLNSSAQLVLSFDDLQDDAVDYIYQIEHCDQDWNSSGLNELDFIDGFNGERLEEYEFSFNTLKDYTHYDLLLPNEDIRWIISGNFLVHILEDNDARTPVITRRFMVAEPLLRVNAELVASSQVGKYRTHQEIDFVANHKGLDIRNPRSEITAVVLQNGRWDNAVTGLKPSFIKGEDLLFDFQNKIVFPAGKEFRFVDLRTFRYATEGVADIQRTENEYDVVLSVEKSRTYRNFNAYEDINGRFVIDHLEEDTPDLEGDYAIVFFTLGVTQEVYDTDIYLFGAVTDWQLKEEFKLKYNPVVNGYVGRVLLKQGFYNYLYVAVPEGSKEIDYEIFEGDWHQTENEYTILMYYRPFGSRYDRLITAYNLRVNQR